MSKCAEGLGPDHAKVSGTPIVDLGEAAIEDVSKHGHAECGDDCFAAFIIAIGDITEEKRNRYLSDGVCHLSVVT